MLRYADLGSERESTPRGSTGLLVYLLCLGSNWSIVSFKVCVSLLNFCLVDLSIGVSGILKFPTIIVLVANHNMVLKWICQFEFTLWKRKSRERKRVFLREAIVMWVIYNFQGCQRGVLDSSKGKSPCVMIQFKQRKKLVWIDQSSLWSVTVI